MTSNSHDSTDEQQSPPLNLFFRLAVFAATVFVVTILAFVAAIFGDPQSPAIRTINNYGGQIIFWEGVLLLVVTVLAMGMDRWQSRTQQRHRSKELPETQ